MQQYWTDAVSVLLFLLCNMSVVFLMDLLWFSFILGLNFIFFCLKIIIIHYHMQKQKKRNVSQG